MAAFISSVRDPALSATLLSRTALHYSLGADAPSDRPAHVRAGSSLAWLGNRIAVIQDDANFVALVDPGDGWVDALPLPLRLGGLRLFDDERGNKRFKLDLEACFNVQLADREILVALGSGSSELRETVAIIDSTGQVETFEAGSLYSRLRSATEFRGSELNIEGAVFMDGWVRLFNRGNGALRNGLKPINATCDIPWTEFESCLRESLPPPGPWLHNVTQFDLGNIQGDPLTFTDAATTEFGLLYTVTAENSLDAVSDGTVTGSAIGVMDASRGCRWIELRSGDGGLFTDKIEGVCASRKGKGLIYVAVDADDPSRPSDLCEVALAGPWF